jgi:peroxiredoxin
LTAFAALFFFAARDVMTDFSNSNAQVILSRFTQSSQRTQSKKKVKSDTLFLFYPGALCELCVKQILNLKSERNILYDSLNENALSRDGAF